MLSPKKLFKSPKSYSGNPTLWEAILLKLFELHFWSFIHNRYASILVCTAKFFFWKPCRFLLFISPLLDLIDSTSTSWRWKQWQWRSRRPHWWRWWRRISWTENCQGWELLSIWKLHLDACSLSTKKSFHLHQDLYDCPQLHHSIHYCPLRSSL